MLQMFVGHLQILTFPKCCDKRHTEDVILRTLKQTTVDVFNHHLCLNDDHLGESSSFVGVLEAKQQDVVRFEGDLPFLFLMRKPTT